MNFFDKLTKKASETYKFTKEKTAKISEELKLRNKINENKNRIEEIYHELGKGISNLEDEISKLKSEILSIKDLKKCISCDEEIDIKSEYCSKCGAKQPEIQEKVEIKEEPEEAKEAEIIDVKDAEENDNKE